MATVADYMPVADNFSTPRIQSEDPTNTQSVAPWDQTLYSDPSLLRSRYCDLMESSPDLSNSLSWLNSEYPPSLPQFNPNHAISPPFLFEDLDTLARDWGDLTDSTHSLVPEMDPLSLEKASTRVNERSNSIPLHHSTNDESPFQSPRSSSDTSDAASYDCDYAAPLSWERPGPGQGVKNAASFTLLSPEEESRLLAIAMPAQISPVSSPLPPSPKPVSRGKTRKRKSSESSESDSSCAPHGGCLSPRKSAHNMVEKRYRSNLNQKIALLRDSVPSMRALEKDNSRREDSKNDLQGLSPVRKLNKSTILTKAVEYIDFLIKQNKCLTKENQALKCKSVSPKRL